MGTPISNSRPRLHFIWWIVAGVLALLPAVWAGDAPFIADEPQLILNALRANAAGDWARVGLTGTVGWDYGPLPTWIYQIGLSITHDPVVLVELRAVIVTAATLAAVLWIANVCGFPIVWMLCIATSPYLLYFSRQLWDNSFNIPFAAVLTALTLHGVIRRKIWPLPFVIAAAGCMLLVHPMSLPLLATVAIFWMANASTIWKSSSKRSRDGALIAVVAVCAIGWFATSGYRQAAFHPLSQAVVKSDWANGWWFATLSPRLLSAFWIDYFFPLTYLSTGPAAAAFKIAVALTGLAFVLAGAGACLTVFQLKQIFRSPSAGLTAGAFALVVIFLQIPLNGITHTFGHPHYYNATWIAPALLIGVALTSAQRVKGLSQISGGTLAAALLACSLYIFVNLHSTGGTRFESSDRFRGYGPTLANQIEIMEAMRRIAVAPPIEVRVPIMGISLQALEKLAPPSLQSGPIQHAQIEYQFPTDPRSGRIQLRAEPASTINR